ncbi:MAG: penicillin-binding protein activator [Xanthomonadales bacterium]|nr:penicillin-binding protein activator [Xanthomonadales bacterium]
MNIPPTIQTLRFAAAALLSLLILAACATAPAPAPVGPAEARRAQSAEALGNFAEAAELWQQAAMVASGPDREAFRLRAAEAWLQAGRENRSSSVLASVDDSKLSGGNIARFALLNAELAMVAGDLDRAEFYLDVASRALPAELRERHRQLGQRVSRLRVDPSGFALATVATALRDMDGYDTNSGVALLQLLEDVPSGKLEELASPPATIDRLDHWPRLSLLIRRALIADADLAPLAMAWASEHPQHAVTETGFVDLANAYRGLFRRPARMAIMLPNQGGLEAAGSAIRDGLIGAYLDSAEPVELRFHATNDGPESAVSAYYTAISEGAEWVIGPLRRESVDALRKLGSLGAPFLMLNTPADLTGDTPGDLVFSLSLSQELEARAIARKALEHGMTTAVALFADTTWGQRVQAAFSDEFAAGGGTVTASASFKPADSDHGELLKQLLQINESQDRKNRLQATLGISLAFEATRRDDFDLFFLAAEPEQGRQIRPQLRFYDAGAKPVLAMGRIFTGKPDRELDLDLDGIVFPTTRWHTRPQADQPPLASVRNGSMGSLHDLGTDAWNLVPWLPLLRKDPDLRFPGQTGDLYLAGSGQLLRDPIWARFSGGVPVQAELPSGGY